MIDWQRICLNLRSHYKPLSKVAKKIGCDEGTLTRLARADTREPKYSIGVKLLGLHKTICPDQHAQAIGKQP